MLAIFNTTLHEICTKVFRERLCSFKDLSLHFKPNTRSFFSSKPPPPLINCYSSSTNNSNEMRLVP